MNLNNLCVYLGDNDKMIYEAHNNRVVGIFFHREDNGNATKVIKLAKAPMRNYILECAIVFTSLKLQLRSMDCTLLYLL